MNDLISRKALLAEYDRVHIGEPGKARKLMEDAPTVDAVEVVHATWENVHNEKGCCSNCNRLDSIDNLATHCRYCGAKMDGERKDN